MHRRSTNKIVSTWSRWVLAADNVCEAENNNPSTWRIVIIFSNSIAVYMQFAPRLRDIDTFIFLFYSSNKNAFNKIWDLHNLTTAGCSTALEEINEKSNWCYCSQFYRSFGLCSCVSVENGINYNANLKACHFIQFFVALFFAQYGCCVQLLFAVRTEILLHVLARPLPTTAFEL